MSAIKMLREHLCTDYAKWVDEWPVEIHAAVDNLIDLIDKHRPLDVDGQHGNLHTPTCGCDDKPGTPW